MKRVIYILIILALVLNSSMVYADSTSTNINLTLEEALKSIENKNPEIKLMDRKIEILERQYNDSLKKAEIAKDRTSLVEKDNIAFRKDELLNWRTSHNLLNNLKYDRENTLQSMKSNVAKKYKDALLTQAEIANLQKEVSDVDKTIEQMKLRVKLGQAKSTDIKIYEAQRLQLNFQINTIHRQFKIDMLSLKKDLGIATASNLVLSPTKTELKLFDDKEIAAQITKAIEKSYRIEKKKNDLELAKLEYNIVKSNTIGELSDDAKALETTIKEKEAALDSAIVSQEAALWNSYYSLKNLEDSIEISKFDVETAQINLDITAAHLKVGKATQHDLSKQRLELAKKNADLQRTINNYMLAAEEFVLDLTE